MCAMSGKYLRLIRLSVFLGIAFDVYVMIALAMFSFLKIML